MKKRRGRRAISSLSKDYQKYHEKFYREKKRGNVKNGIKILSYSEFKEARKEHLSMKQMLEPALILKNKEQEKKAWKEFTRIKKIFQRGEKYEMENTYFGGSDPSSEGETISEGLGYHYSLTGLLKDRDALHFLISFKIDAGYNRAKVLADYGY